MDALEIIWFICLVFVLSPILELFLFHRMALRFVYERRDREMVALFPEYLFKAVYHAAIEIYFLTLTYGQQEFKLPIKFYLMTQFWFYCYNIKGLLSWKTRSGDFVVLMFHYVFVLILIGCSYNARFFRIGSIIFALHEPSDFFLEAAKVFNYLGKQLGASIFLGLYAISCLLLRQTIFPFLIFRTPRFYPHDKNSELTNFSCSFTLALSVDVADIFKGHPGLYFVFTMMLVMLLSFDLHWWIQFWPIMMRQLRNRGRVE